MRPGSGEDPPGAGPDAGVPTALDEVDPDRQPGARHQLPAPLSTAALSAAAAVRVFARAIARYTVDRVMENSSSSSLIVCSPAPCRATRWAGLSPVIALRRAVPPTPALVLPAILAVALAGCLTTLTAASMGAALTAGLDPVTVPVLTIGAAASLVAGTSSARSARAIAR